MANVLIYSKFLFYSSHPSQLHWSHMAVAVAVACGCCCGGNRSSIESRKTILTLKAKPCGWVDDGCVVAKSIKMRKNDQRNTFYLRERTEIYRGEEWDRLFRYIAVMRHVREVCLGLWSRRAPPETKSPICHKTCTFGFAFGGKT